jgi:plasmid stabilization system protein ParE
VALIKIDNVIGLGTHAEKSRGLHGSVNIAFGSEAAKGLSQPAAEKVGSRIIREAENVAAFPRLGRIVPEFGNRQIREIISQPYRVIYKFDEEGDLVAILRIWHGARGTPQLADDS